MFLLKEGRQRFFLHNKSASSRFPGHCFRLFGYRTLKKEKKYLPLCGSKIGRGDWTEDEQHILKVVWRGPEESRISERVNF